MTQKSRIIIDTNRHGIRRETNLDAEYKAYLKKKEKKSYRRKPKEH